VGLDEIPSVCPDEKRMYLRRDQTGAGLMLVEDFQ
jgi:hypothetical protein